MAGSPRLERWSEDQLEGWRTLQELAGGVTPLSEANQAEEDLAEQHRGELESLRREFEG